VRCCLADAVADEFANRIAIDDRDKVPGIDHAPDTGD